MQDCKNKVQAGSSSGTKSLTRPARVSLGDAVLESPEALLQLSEISLTILNNLHGIVYLADSELRLVTWNKASEQVLGVTADELAGRNMLDFLVDEDKEKAAAAGARVLVEGKADVEVRIMTARGEVIPYHFSGSKIVLDGKPYVTGMGVDVSREVRAREHLKQSEEKFSRAFHASPVVFAITEAQGDRFLEVNSTFEEVTGYSRAEVIGRTTMELGLYASPARYYELRQKIEKTRSLRNEEVDFLARGGKLIVSLLSADLVDIKGTWCILSVVRDITDVRSAESALRESQRKLNLHLEQSMLGVIEWSPDGDVLDWSTGAEKIFGFTRAEVLGRNANDLIVPQDLRDYISTVFSTLAHKSGGNYSSNDNLTKDGRRISCEWFSTAISDDHGNITSIISLVQDESEKVRAKEKLQASEEKFRIFFETMPEYAYMVTPDGNILNVNEAACSVLERTKEELIGQPMKSIYPPEFHEKVAAEFERWTVEGSIKDLELVIVSKSGRRRTVLLNSGAMRDGYGNILHSTCVQTDITDRKIAEEELKEAHAGLRESEARFRLILDTAPVLIWMTNEDKRLTEVNQGWLSFMGGRREAELEKNLCSRVHPEDVERSLDALNLAYEGRMPFTFECRMRRHDGRFRWVVTSGVPRFLTDGSFVGFIGCSVDVHDLRESEQRRVELAGRLINAQEEERSRIARQLHDEIAGDLALLAINIQRIDKDASACEESRHKQLQELWSRANSILNQVSSLSHRLHSSMLKHLGLAPALEGICRDFEKQHSVKVSCDCGAVPRTVDDAVSLCLFRVAQEALHNIAKHSNAKNIHVKLEQAGSSLRLSVRDDGDGFDPDSSSSWKGLGLISMRERVQLVNGRLNITSNPSTGTLVQATVPKRGSRNTART